LINEKGAVAAAGLLGDRPTKQTELDPAAGTGLVGRRPERL
jgi:hypothetical protein